jgi:hypothetical protein
MEGTFILSRYFEFVLLDVENISENNLIINSIISKDLIIDEDDILKLAKKAYEELHLIRAICIGNESYGDRISVELIKLWNSKGPVEKFILVEDTSVAKTITDNSTQINNCNAVFVASYGKILIDTIKTLNLIVLDKNKTKIFITSTVNVPEWKNQILNELKTMECYYSQPELKEVQENLIGDFICETVRHLKYSVELIEKNDDFNKAWINTKQYNNTHNNRPPLSFECGRTKFEMQVKQFK